MKMARLMDRQWKIPPASKHALSTPTQLATRLQRLIGQKFSLTGKSRTDGANVRKLVTATLLNYPLPEPASNQDYVIVPPRKKGVPKILREFIDTYIVTTGNSYNLQVWNRNPASQSVQVQYANGSVLSAKDVRFIFVPIDPITETINSIVVLTPKYIEENFGPFGKPTIKHQLILPDSARDTILSLQPPVFTGADTSELSPLVTSSYVKPAASIHAVPQPGMIFDIALLDAKLSKQLLGMIIPTDATKTRGQTLEKIVARLLGYATSKEPLAGGYPDVMNQLLEVKIQDSPTVDLGRYSPQFEEPVPEMESFTTRDVRYLIALTNPTMHTIDGLIFISGEDLGKHFTYVTDESYKCQRSISMNFFDALKGKSVFNP